MKKFIKPYSSIFIGAAIILAGCGVSNPVVFKEYNQLVKLEKEKQKIEKKYLYTLGHLEKYPGQRELRLQQASLKNRITELSVEIKKAREQLNLSEKEWENRVIGGRMEEQLIDKTERGTRKLEYERDE